MKKFILIFVCSASPLNTIFPLSHELVNRKTDGVSTLVPVTRSEALQNLDRLLYYLNNSDTNHPLIPVLRKEGAQVTQEDPDNFFSYFITEILALYGCSVAVCSRVYKNLSWGELLCKPLVILVPTALLLGSTYYRDGFAKSITRWFNDANVHLQKNYDAALFEAVHRRNHFLVAALLKAGASANARNSQGETLLYRVVSIGDALLLKLVLIYGANTHERTQALSTTLRNGHYSCARALIENNADLVDMELVERQTTIPENKYYTMLIETCLKRYGPTAREVKRALYNLSDMMYIFEKQVKLPPYVILEIIFLTENLWHDCEILYRGFLADIEVTEAAKRTQTTTYKTLLGKDFGIAALFVLAHHTFKKGLCETYMHKLRCDIVPLTTTRNEIREYDAYFANLLKMYVERRYQEKNRYTSSSSS